MLVYKPVKKVAPARLGYIAAITVIAIFAFIIAFFITFKPWLLIIGLAFLGLDMILSHCLCWCKETRMELKNDKLMYYYDDIVTGLAGNTTTYTIKEIEQVDKRKNGEIYISGNILLKEPMSKTKNVKGFTMKYYTKEMEQQIEQFKNKE